MNKAGGLLLLVVDALIGVVEVADVEEIVVVVDDDDNSVVGFVASGIPTFTPFSLISLSKSFQFNPVITGNIRPMNQIGLSP